MTVSNATRLRFGSSRRRWLGWKGCWTYPARPFGAQGRRLREHLLERSRLGNGRDGTQRPMRAASTMSRGNPDDYTMRTIRAEPFRTDATSQPSPTPCDGPLPAQPLLHAQTSYAIPGPCDQPRHPLPHLCDSPSRALPLLHRPTHCDVPPPSGPCRPLCDGPIPATPLRHPVPHRANPMRQPKPERSYP
jgi:hypothetical protein